MEKQKIKHLTLWRKYKKSKKVETKLKYRNQIIEVYYPFLQKMSYKMSKKLKYKVSPDELCSFGVDGLIIAVEKFSLDRGVDFPAYASLRISGSMIDGMRREDNIPRSVRLNNTLVEKAKQEIENKESRKVGDEEVAEVIGVPPEEYIRNLKKYNPALYFCINGSSISNEEDYDKYQIDKIEVIIDGKSSSPDTEIKRKEFLNKLISKSFSPVEQKIIYYYYYLNMNMEDISKKIYISESRISQIHKDILPRLKEKIERNPKFFGQDIEEYIKNFNFDEIL